MPQSASLFSSYSSTISSQDLSTFGRVCICHGTLSSHITQALRKEKTYLSCQIGHFCVRMLKQIAWVWIWILPEPEECGMNSRDPLSEAVLTHCGVSRKIPCLAGSPPVPLCSLRVVVPGLPSLISLCPQSLTRSAPSPILLPHPFQICAWGHLGPSLALVQGPCHLQSSYPVPAPRMCFPKTSLSPRIQFAVHGTWLRADSICLLCCALRITAPQLLCPLPGGMAWYRVCLQGLQRGAKLWK